MPNDSIHYPRHRLVRGGIRTIGRALLPLLTRTTIKGQKNFPKKGPLIVIGNHVAAMEAVLMILCSPWQVEVLGNGDIPFEPGFTAFVKAYQFIPIKRGSLDRPAMMKALSVLKQDGILGIFPEGGTWNTQKKEPKTGVAWLSYHGNAPILPIGYGAVQAAVLKVVTLRRPHLAMNVGKPLPPVKMEPGKSRKQVFIESFQAAMDAVWDLMPIGEQEKLTQMTGERFEFKLKAKDLNGTLTAIPEELAIQDDAALSKFLYRPIIMNVFRRNLRMPVHALNEVASGPEPKAVADAITPILLYLEVENPYFLIYRFGQDEGTAMKTALAELQTLCRWADHNNFALEYTPIRRYKMVDQEEEIVETSPGEAHKY